MLAGRVAFRPAYEPALADEQARARATIPLGRGRRDARRPGEGSRPVCGPHAGAREEWPAATGCRAAGRSAAGSCARTICLAGAWCRRRAGRAERPGSSTPGTRAACAAPVVITLSPMTSSSPITGAWGCLIGRHPTSRCTGFRFSVSLRCRSRRRRWVTREAQSTTSACWPPARSRRDPAARSRSARPPGRQSPRRRRRCAWPRLLLPGDRRGVDGGPVRGASVRGAAHRCSADHLGDRDAINLRPPGLDGSGTRIRPPAPRRLGTASASPPARATPTSPDRSQLLIRRRVPDGASLSSCP